MKGLKKYTGLNWMNESISYCGMYACDEDSRENRLSKVEVGASVVVVVLGRWGRLHDSGIVKIEGFWKFIWG